MTDNVITPDETGKENPDVDASGGNTEELTIDQLKEQLALALGQKEDAVKSRNEFKSKLKAIEDKAETETAKALEEQGKYKELYEASIEKFAALEAKQLSSEKRMLVRDKLQEEGVSSMETALKVVDMNSIKVNEGVIDVDSVADAVAQMKKEHQILFGEKKDDKTGMGVTRPAGSDESLKTLETEMAACKTQQQLDAVLKKYGKF